MDRHYLVGILVVIILIFGATQGRITVDCKRGCPSGQCYNYKCPFYPCKRKTDVCQDRLSRLRGAFCRPEYCGGCFARWYIWMYPVSDREIDVTHRCNRGRGHRRRLWYPSVRYHMW